MFNSYVTYPLVIIDMENGPVEILRFPIKHVIFHSYVNHYQRIQRVYGHLEHLSLGELPVELQRLETAR